MIDNFMAVFNLGAVTMLIPFSIMIYLIYLGGPNVIFNWQTRLVGLFAFMIMWGMVMLLAYLDAVFSFENLGFFGGILALTGVIVFMHPHVQKLPDSHWSNSPWFVWGILTFSFLCVVTFENITKWSKSDVHLNISDWWYLAVAPFFFYWFAHAVIAGGVQIHRSGEWLNTTATWITAALLVLAVATFILQLLKIGGTKKWGLNIFGGSILLGAILQDAVLYGLRATTGIAAALDPTGLFANLSGI